MTSVRRVEEIAFTSDETASVVARMDQLAASDGWINVVPRRAGSDDPYPALSFTTLFSGGGPAVTMCTWVQRQDGRGRRWTELGIAHMSGHRAAPQLLDQDNPVPSGWVVEQDHPRRGLVLSLPTTEPHEAVLQWGLRAVEVLAEVPRPFAAWRAEVHHAHDSDR